MLRAADVLEKTAGKRPVGIRTPSWDFSPNTLAMGNDASIDVRIEGLNAGAASGLRLFSGASNSVLRGVAITRFANYGVVLSGQNVANSLTNVLVVGNFIGTDGTGAGDDRDRSGPACPP